MARSKVTKKKTRKTRRAKQKDPAYVHHERRRAKEEPINYAESPICKLSFYMLVKILALLPKESSFGHVNREFHDQASRLQAIDINYKKLPQLPRFRRRELRNIINRKPWILEINTRMHWLEYELNFQELTEHVRDLTLYNWCICDESNHQECYGPNPNNGPELSNLIVLLKGVQFLKKFSWIGFHIHIKAPTTEIPYKDLPEFDTLTELYIQQPYYGVLPIFYKTQKLKYLALMDKVDEVLLTNNTELIELKLRFFRDSKISEEFLALTYPFLKRLIIISHHDVDTTMLEMIKRFTGITKLHITVVGANLLPDLTDLKQLKHLVEVKLAVERCFDSNKLIVFSVGPQLIALDLMQSIELDLPGEGFLQNLRELAKVNPRIRFLRLKGILPNFIIATVLESFLNLEHLDLRLCKKKILFNQASIDMLCASKLKRLSVSIVRIIYEQQLMERFYSDGEVKQDMMQIEYRNDVENEPSVRLVYENGDLLPLDEV